MPTLTLKNIPKDLHAQLKQSAEKNHRSLNREILVRLERDFSAPAVDAETVAARMVKAFAMKLLWVEHAKVSRYKRQSRA